MPSAGIGDTDLGVKWKFHRTAEGSKLPALAASLYIESPTGDVHRQLGSGLTDYWLNFIVQQPLSKRTRLTVNAGFLFAGNTGTGVIGIQTTRGHVYTGGLSLLHDISSRLTVGGEIYGGIADNHGLGRSQLQGLVGGTYTIRHGLTFAFGVLGGKDRLRSKLDFEVNRRAESEIQTLSRKLNLLDEKMDDMGDLLRSQRVR